MFNSLRCAKKLEEAGVPREQAEAHVLIISEILEMNLASKQDLEGVKHEIGRVKQELRQEIASVEQRLEQKIIQSEQRMTIKLGTIVSLSIGVAVTLAKIVS